ncbi:hypothetical protein SQ03_11385, partial [Methylobacterium platani JCM 14648]
MLLSPRRRRLAVLALTVSGAALTSLSALGGSTVVAPPPEAAVPAALPAALPAAAPARAGERAEEDGLRTGAALDTGGGLPVSAAAYAAAAPEAPLPFPAPDAAITPPAPVPSVPDPGRPALGTEVDGPALRGAVEAYRRGQV